MHYFDIYDRAFSSFRDKKVTVVEIGVFHGGSLQMWKKYFGRRAHIFGIDIDERVKSLVERRVRIVTGDQGGSRLPTHSWGDNRACGHPHRRRWTQDGAADRLLRGTMASGQRRRCLSRGGPAHQIVAGIRRRLPSRGHLHRVGEERDRRAECKALAQSDGLEVGSLTRSIRAMHIYDSVVDLEEGVVDRPHYEMTGKQPFDSLV